MYLCFSWFMCVSATLTVDLEPGQRRKSSICVVIPKWMERIKHKACIRCSPTSHTVTRLLYPWLDCKLKIKLTRKHHSHTYSVLWENQPFFLVQKKKLIRTDQSPASLPACFQQHAALSAVSEKDRKLTQNPPVHKACKDISLSLE